jgi:hypothetical protein
LTKILEESNSKKNGKGSQRMGMVEEEYNENLRREIEFVR